MTAPVQRFDVRVDPDGAIDAAVVAVAAGQCIVLPTDTVYGIGADASSPSAVQSLLEAKRRGRDMPPPVLIAEVSMLRSLAAEVTPQANALAEAFWPGALTLIVNAQPSLRMDLGDRGETIAVRVPDHQFTRELLRATGPLAVSSANVSGRTAAMTIEEAVDQLSDSVAVYLDDGPASEPVPSTIVDLTAAPRVLRAGRISREELGRVVPELGSDDASPPDLDAQG